MQVKIGFIISGFTWLFSIHASAQSPTLENLIRTGLEKNLSIQAGAMESIVSASDTLVSSLEKNPELNIDAGYNVNEPTKPRSSIRISQEIQPRIQKNKYRFSKANLASKIQFQKSQMLNLEAEIRMAFYKWQIVNQKIKLQVEIATRWESFSKIVEAKRKVGRLSEMDEVQAKLTAAHARQKEIELNREMDSLEKNLELLSTNSQPLDSLSLISLIPLPQIVEVDSLDEWAMRENSDLKTRSLEISAKKIQVELENSRKNPPLTFSLGVERETEGSNILTGGFAIPLSVFNRNRSEVTRSKAELSLSEIQLKKMREEVKNEVKQSHAQILALQERYLYTQKVIEPLSRKQLALSQKGFAQGLLGIFEMSRVEEEFQNQEMEALEVLEVYYEKWIQLGKTTGGKTWKF